VTEYSDQELVKLFGQSDKRNFAFNLIVKNYQERLYWHIRKFLFVHEDSDDVLQDTFIKAFKNLDKFRSDSNLYTWLYRIATNEALNHLQKQKRKCENTGHDISELISDNLIADVHFSGDEMQLKFQQALIQLPEKQRLVFNMKYFDNMKYDEISDILETSVGGLKASYFHAVKKIEQFIKSELN